MPFDSASAESSVTPKETKNTRGHCKTPLFLVPCKSPGKGAEILQKVCGNLWKCFCNDLGACLRGRTATQPSKKGSGKVLGRVLGKGSQKGCEKGACYGLYSKKKGSQKGSQKGF